MTTLVLPRGVGHASIVRGYAVTLGTTLGVKTLLERLWELYRRPVTFEQYRDSVSALVTEVSTAMEGDELSDEAKSRAFRAVTPAIEFLLARPLHVPAPEVEVWPNGTIAFEWYQGQGMIVNAAIDGNRRLAFSALIGQTRRSGIDFIDGEWPGLLVQSIQAIGE
jgi:hypothetical protein